MAAEGAETTRNPRTRLRTVINFQGIRYDFAVWLASGLEPHSETGRAHPLGLCAEGNLADANGAPESVLRVNGSPFGVVLGVGEQLSIEVRQPSCNPEPSGFALYGTPTIARGSATLPLGMGWMCFLPSLGDASRDFTLADNLSAGCSREVVLSTPAPWTLSVRAAPIERPIGFTLQGIIEQAPGLLRTTNAVFVVAGAPEAGFRRLVRQRASRDS